MGNIDIMYDVKLLFLKDDVGYRVKMVGEASMAVGRGLWRDGNSVG